MKGEERELTPEEEWEERNLYVNYIEAMLELTEKQEVEVRIPESGGKG